MGRRFRKFIRRRRYYPRKTISKRFNFKRYLRRTGKKVEIKWVNKTWNNTVTPGTTFMEIVHMDTIVQGVAIDQFIGRHIRARYLTMNIMLTQNEGAGNVGNNFQSRFRICILKPRVSQAKFEEHMTTVGTYGSFDPSVVRVLYDDYVFLHNPTGAQNINGRPYWHHKKAYRHPLKIQLGNDGKFLDYQDQVFIRIISYSNNNSSVALQGRCKLSYTDA